MLVDVFWRLWRLLGSRAPSERTLLWVASCCVDDLRPSIDAESLPDMATRLAASRLGADGVAARRAAGRG